MSLPSHKSLRLLSCALMLVLIGFSSQPANANIVKFINGQVELKLYPFFSAFDEQTLVRPLGTYNRSATLVGTSYSVGGTSHIDYTYLTNGPGENWITTYAYVESEDAPDGGGGYVDVELDLYTPAPFYYRLEAVLLENPMGGVSLEFDGTSASAGYNFADGFPTGSNFPLIFKNLGGAYMPVGWGDYVDEGFLSEGHHDLLIHAGSTIYKDFAQNSCLQVSLLVQLQGDTDMDGFVGLDDLDTVLEHWNQHVPIGETGFGDVSHDGVVGLDDLDLILNNWNVDVASGSIIVPEPSAASLLCVVYLGLIGGRGVSLRRRA